MTNPNRTAISTGTQEPYDRKLYYPLTPDLAQELRDADLTAAEWRLWSLLVTLDPFGDHYQELPDLLKIMRECEMSKATFYRAIAKFEDIGLFDTQPLKLAFKNLRGQKIVSNLRKQSQECDDSFKPEKAVSNLRKQSQECENRTAQTAQIRTNKQNNLNLLKNNRMVPTTHPVENEQKGIGTHALDLLIEKAGIPLNKTIKKIVATLENQLDAAAARQAVENAVSALQEQQQQGTIRNPGGFLVSALRGNFTANYAKREAKAKQGVTRDSATSSPTRSTPLDIHTVARAVDWALQQGDRLFALHKLQHFWKEGWKQEIEELCVLRKRDWHFQITVAGVSDA